MNRLNEAVRSYLRALSIRPEDFNANLNLGTAYLQLKEPAQALPFAEKAVQIDGKSTAAPTSLARSTPRWTSARRRLSNTSRPPNSPNSPRPAPAEPRGKPGESAALRGNGRHAGAGARAPRNPPPPPTSDSARACSDCGNTATPRRLSASRSLDIDPNHYPALNGVGVCLLNKYVWSGNKDEVGA